jgi:energy-coupling factor transporter ATP-binding protein EcfA2
MRTGIVFQNSRLQMVGSSVEEDLAFGLTVLNLSPQTIRSKVNQYLNLFGLTEKRQHGAHQLSGGELKRLALAGVLITEPDLLILDEPLSMLDFENQQIFLRCLGDLVPRETTVLWLDHDLRSLRYTEEIFLLSHKGTIDPISFDQLNSAAFLEEYKLQPTPLQPLEWKHPERIRKTILGPERVEFNRVMC